MVLALQTEQVAVRLQTTELIIAVAHLLSKQAAN